MPADHKVLPGVPWATLGVISAGGVIGALARYGLIAAFPEPDVAFVWPVFWINVTGCLLIGIVVVTTEVRRAHRLLRPFLATGVLGGFTTFSTYVAGMQHELAAGAPRTALLYGAVTVVAALAAAWCGVRFGVRTVGLARRRWPW
jgi:CrcB protein